MPAAVEDRRIFNGGAREGSGRSAGQKAKLTLLKEKTLIRMESHIAKMSAKLMNAHAIAAVGTHRMVVMKEDPLTQKISMITIRDEKRMQKLLDEGEYGKDYLVLEGKEIDWRACDALITRAYGKPKEKVEISGGIGILHLIEQLNSNDTPGDAED